ncbi:glycoside hydrolase family 15 protein [Planosporangium sp. 12N6]|uniref:glycoside hydrolase family 15 protein n=1 Tax=Planosporangium spinosum TaxID=3402278 RepID=UPI003CE79F0F
MHVLREYAVLADGHRGALIGPGGEIDWMCAPRWDDEAVFAGLLGGPGRYLVTPANPRFVWGGYYEQGTLIWTSRWVTTTGIVECREALAFPGHPRRVVLLRRIHAVQGRTTVRVVLDPRAGFGRHPLRDLHRDDTVWTGRTGGLHVRWTGGGGARPDEDGALSGVIEVPEGGYHDLVMELGPERFDGSPPDPNEAWLTTGHTWRSDRPSFAGCVAARDAAHAHAVLRGLTCPGGGMVAAVTMSLPERARAGRSYDYRYAWIRDQCFAGQAAAVVGADGLTDAAVTFIADRLLADGPAMAPACTTVGDPVPEQRPLDFLPGYPGGQVMVGNWVGGQFQLDVFGEALLLFAAAGGRDRLDARSWHAAEIAADTIGQRWREPDAGIWELQPHHWTESKLTCVAGLKAAARVAPTAQAADWLTCAEKILAHTAAHGLHPSGRWQRAFDDDRLDAALLLPAVRGALPPDDPRVVATHRAVIRDLGEDGYLYRFRPDERPLGEAECAFLLCGLVAALSAHRAGARVAGRAWFERNRSACGPPGLYAEEYDVRQRQLRGNLPQAFVHALLLQAAVALAAD